MPIIEYECECGNKFDEIILSQAKVTSTFKCSKCGKEAKRAETPSVFGFNADDLKRGRK